MDTELTEINQMSPAVMSRGGTPIGDVVACEQQWNETSTENRSKQRHRSKRPTHEHGGKRHTATGESRREHGGFDMVSLSPREHGRWPRLRVSNCRD